MSTLYFVNRVTIWCCGLAGLYCARALRFAPLELTVVVPPSGIPWSHLLSPVMVELLLAQQRNVQVRVEQPIFVDARHRQLLFASGALGYDALVIDSGAPDGSVRENNPAIQELLAVSLGMRADERGCFGVTEQLTIPEYPDLMLLGQCARAEPVLGSTLAQGRYAATVLRDQLSGLDPLPYRPEQPRRLWWNWRSGSLRRPAEAGLGELFQLAGGFSGIPTFLRLRRQMREGGRPLAAA